MIWENQRISNNDVFSSGSIEDDDFRYIVGCKRLTATVGVSAI